MSPLSISSPIKCALLGGIFSLGLAAGVVSPTPVLAFADDIRKCAHAQPRAAIPACGNLIDWGGLNRTGLSVLHTSRGNHYARLRDYRRAHQDYRTALILQPRNALAHYNRGVLFLRTYQYHAALKDFDSTLRIQPTSDRALVGRGLIYTEFRQHKKAARDYAAAMRLNPKFHGPYIGKGYDSFVRGKHREAIRYFEKAIELGPSNGCATALLAAAFAGVKQYDEAIALLKTAERFETDQMGFAMIAAYIYREAGDLTNALKYANKALAQFPGDPNVLSVRGTILEELGKRDGAMNDFRAALFINPNLNESKAGVERLSKKR